MDVTVVRRPPFGSTPTVGERGSDTRRRILDAALAVFADVGFPEARVELITAKAGCSRPAFYQYFSSKDDVFWTLAGELGGEMVTLARRLERVTPDAAGLDHLRGWIGEFMALHAAWEPVFASFQAASRGHEPQARSSGAVSDRTARALLRAFGADEQANGRVMSAFVAVLIRCSFYAEHAPAELDPQPLVDGLAQLLHRLFAGPIEGVNVDRSRPPRRRRVAIAAPEPNDGERVGRARGEATRQRLLEAGASVLPARGYHDTRVDDIVEAAGVSHGTFYRYFGNKDEFFRVLAEAASGRMLALVDQLRLDATPDELRAWSRAWCRTYETDGGIISTWQEMQTNLGLAEFSTQVAASVFTRLARTLERRGFGDADVDATMLMALIERVPYSVFTLGFVSEEDAVEAMVAIIRRGFLALER